MKRYGAIIMAMCMASSMPVLAQADTNRPCQEQGETITSEQAAQVKQMLSHYDAASLTAADAMAIHDAFREAGLRGGPAMNETIRAAGFDPDELRDLAPPLEVDMLFACLESPRQGESLLEEDMFFALLASTNRVEPVPEKMAGSFQLTSPAVEDGGMLPLDFTGDGAAATLPLNWSGAPEGTKSFALIMHHIAPDRTKWYWILYNIPATTSGLPINVSDDVGTRGNNSVNDRAEYAPPHSKGPGRKTYIYTVYALSEPVSFDVAPDRIGRPELLAAMQGRILASAELRTVYERKGLDDKKPPVEQ